VVQGCPSTATSLAVRSEGTLLFNYWNNVALLAAKGVDIAFECARRGGDGTDVGQQPLDCVERGLEMPASTAGIRGPSSNSTTSKGGALREALPLLFRAWTPGDAMDRAVWGIAEPKSDKPPRRWAEW
jgi:hypothetical protein